mmetsp:Transcript_19544/g.60816  ORF Transcript_19544/g.60816 Transcript_19544/m.60816 type:complete len:238 (-) Transcript_19544:217-930(-)
MCMMNVRSSPQRHQPGQSQNPNQIIALSSGCLLIREGRPPAAPRMSRLLLRARLQRIHAHGTQLGRKARLPDLLAQLEVGGVEELLDELVCPHHRMVLAVDEVRAVDDAMLGWRGVIVLNDDPAARPEAGRAPAEEGDELGVGEVADDPLDPHQVVLRRRGRELLQRRREKLAHPRLGRELDARLLDILGDELDEVDLERELGEHIARNAPDPRAAVQRATDGQHAGAEHGAGEREA